MANFFTELKRRNVVKVAIAYAVVAWIIVEISSVVLPALLAPEWVHRVVTFLILIGFPVALIFSWAFELTPGGLKRTHEVPLEQSTTAQTSRKLDFAIIGLLAVAVVFLVLDNYVFVNEKSASSVREDVSGRPSVAVLPFINRSASEENAAFFAAGIHDDLLTQLAKLSALKVISRTSVMEYRDTTKNMRQIGEELGANAILEGGVQRAGDAVRINVQLIDTKNDEHLWAETYDRELTTNNVFAIQSEIATAIAAALQLTLSPEEVTRLDQVPTQNLKAYEHFLNAKELGELATSSRESFETAIGAFEQAIQEDPGFAQAHAEKSLLQSRMYWYGFDRTAERIEQASLSALRSLKLIPDMPEGHLAMGYYHYYAHRDYDNALKEFTLAGEGMPGSFRVLEALGFIEMRLGQFEASLASLDRAIELSPRDGSLMWQQSVTYRLLRRYDESKRLNDLAQVTSPEIVGPYLSAAFLSVLMSGDTTLLHELARNPRLDIGHLQYFVGWQAAFLDRDFDLALKYLSKVNVDVIENQVEYGPLVYFEAYTHFLAGETELATEKFRQAKIHLEEQRDLEPDDPRIHLTLGITYAGLGEDDLAIESAERATNLVSYDNDAFLGPIFFTYAIQIYALLGDVTRTVDALDYYLSRPGAYSAVGIAKHPNFDAIRDEPEFQTVIAKYKTSGKREAESGKK